MPKAFPREVKYLIVGSGPTGLGAAYRLKELGQFDFLVAESSSHVGGLATSFVDEKGFTWDIGGHVQFSHYRYFDEVMRKALGENGWLTHERESWVWILDRFIPYPFQNNIRHLPREEMWKCLDGLVEIYRRPPNRSPINFREWIHATFGDGLAEVFMEPYNFKVWAYPPDEMSYEWIGERVAVTDLSRVLKNVILEKDDLSWGPNNTFQFPRIGGTGAIWSAIADLVGRESIFLGKTLVSISPKGKIARFSDGSEVRYSFLLNTTPLDRFVGAVEGMPDAAKDAATHLKFSSSNIVGIGLRGKKPAELGKKCWMYFPEGDCPFYRVTVFSNYSPNNVPDPKTEWSLMAEVSESSVKPVDAGTLIDDVLDGMRKTQLIDEASEIVSRWAYRAHHGYPTPFLGRNGVLDRIQSELENLGIQSRGRFGGWKYEVSNQDHSMMQGVEWANRVVLNVPETTYFFPATANANWGK